MNNGKEKMNRIRESLVNNKVFAIVLLLIVLMTMLSDKFLTGDNLFNVLRQVCVTTIVAYGFTLVIGAQEIDLSVGSVMGFVGIIMATLMVNYNFSVFAAILVGILVGAFCGLINALIISAINLPPFIVTLATQSLYRGIIYIATHMKPIINLPSSFIQIGQGYIGPVPIPVCIMFVMFAIFWFISRKTTFGRYVVAVGSNKEAAYLCGINITKVRIGIYAALGVCTAVASVVLTGRTASAQVNAGVGLEFDCITAVVIGGTAFTGGTVNVTGSLFGCLIVGIINNGLNLLGVDSNYQIIAKGLMILMALVLDNLTTSFFAKKKN